MSRMVAPLMLVATVLTACAGDGSDCGDASDERQTAFQQWSAAVEDAKVCDANDDCVTYSAPPGCFEGCGYVVNRAEVARLHPFVASLQGRIDQCEAGPCPVPTCAPRPSGVACIERRCEFSDGS
ncbi:hypothetical protein [Sinimarinibacterium flocculans]|uniref:hypothetical protein n=1 Tax=Sinimarinibacterium flocculans TaxID=985250 RepID=UPI003C76FAB7